MSAEPEKKAWFLTAMKVSCVIHLENFAGFFIQIKKKNHQQNWGDMK